MSSVAQTSRGGSATLPAVRTPVLNQERLDQLAADVRAARTRLVDHWDATALVESLGYTDARVHRELGFPDVRKAGEYIYSVCAGSIGPDDRWVPTTKSRLSLVVRSATSTLIYAVPWLAVFVAQVVNPDAVRAPTRVAPALAVALMFSLVASGGFVQAIVRRGEFYVGLKQPGLARQMALTLLRVGSATAIVLALIGIVIAGYFELFEWPSLILAADSFVILSVLWMVSGTFAIRQQQWRVAASFLAGVAVFAMMRVMDVDVVAAQFTAAGVVVVSALAQLPWLFSDGEGRPISPRRVRLPRLSVLVYWTIPYFWYGIVYFAFLFADRLAAGTSVAALTGVPFGVPADYSLGMELALLTLIVSASGVEVAGALFGRSIRTSAVLPFSGDAQSFSTLLLRHYGRAVALTLVTFVTTAVAVAMAAQWALPEASAPGARSTLLAGDVGYACLALGLLNALVLFETQQPWSAVRTLTTALVLNLVSGYVMSHALGSYHASDGLLLGAAYFAASSTMCVLRTLKRSDYAYAIG